MEAAFLSIFQQSLSKATLQLTFNNGFFINRIRVDVLSNNKHVYNYTEWFIQDVIYWI